MTELNKIRRTIGYSSFVRRRHHRRKKYHVKRGNNRHHTERHMKVVDLPDANSTKKLRDFATLLAYTQNVCGLKQVDKLERLVQFSIEKCIDFMCLQETWLEGRYSIDIEATKTASDEPTSCTFFHYGQEKQVNRGSGGVGILLSKRGRDAWERAGSPDPTYAPEINGVARAMEISLVFLDNRNNKVEYFVISAYHPDSGKSAEEHEEFINHLSDLYSTVPSNAIIISGEDVNASLSTSLYHCTFNEAIDGKAGGIGPFGDSTPNERGRQTLESIQSHNLSVASSWFKKKRYNTFYSHLLQRHLQLDHFITSQTGRKSILDCGRANSPINSNHLPVRIKFRIASKIPPKGNERLKPTKLKKRKRGRKKVRDTPRPEYNLLSSESGYHNNTNTSETAAVLLIEPI